MAPTTESAEALLGPKWRKPISLIVIISVTVIATAAAMSTGRALVQNEIAASQSSDAFNSRVTNIARATWSLEAMKAAKEHETFDSRLTAHDAAIKELQVQGSETQRKLDAIILDLSYIKASVNKK